MTEPTIEEVVTRGHYGDMDEMDEESRWAVIGAYAALRAVLRPLERIQKDNDIFWTRQELIDNVVNRIRAALGEK